MVKEKFNAVIVGVGCVFPAFYLMRVIDEITLTTTLQRILIVMYFEIVLFGACLFFDKYKKRLMKQHGLLVGIFVIILCLYAALWGRNFLPQKYLNNTIKIASEKEKNPKAQGEEIWLTGIWLDGKKQDLSPFIDGSEWELVENALVATDENSGILELELAEADKIQLEFIKHPWSGMVNVNCNGTENVLDLFCSDSSVQILELNGNVQCYEKVENIILLVGQTILSLQIMLCAVAFFVRKKTIKVDGV